MGYMRHHTIIVSSYDLAVTAAAREVAVATMGDLAPVTEPLGASINGYWSFAILPDGSKEGWAPSNDADAARTAFIRWLNAQRFSDNSSPLDWVEVQFGDDNRESKVTRHSDEPQYEVIA